MPSSFFDGMGRTLLGIFKERSPAIFLPESGPSVSIEVIFNAVFQEEDANGVAIGSPSPVAWFTTGLIDPSQGDKIEIGQTEYIIREIKPDGLELTMIKLTDL